MFLLGFIHLCIMIVYSLFMILYSLVKAELLIMIVHSLLTYDTMFID